MIYPQPAHIVAACIPIEQSVLAMPILAAAQDMLQQAIPRVDAVDAVVDPADPVITKIYIIVYR